jgi:hypothetical protein
MDRAAHMQLQGIRLYHRPTAKRIGYFTRVMQTSARGSGQGWFPI